MPDIFDDLGFDDPALGLHDSIDLVDHDDVLVVGQLDGLDDCGALDTAIPGLGLIGLL